MQLIQLGKAEFDLVLIASVLESGGDSNASVETPSSLEESDMISKQAEVRHKCLTRKC